MRVFALLSLALLAGCTPAGPSARPSEAEPAGATLAAGGLTAADEAAAAALYDRARESEAAGDLRAAEAAATRIVEEYPGSRVSVEALYLRAGLRARGAGTVPVAGADTLAGPLADRSRWEGARQDLERLIAVLPPEDPRESGARSLLSRVLVSLGDGEEALRTVLSSSADGAVDLEEARWAGEVAAGLDAERLEALLAEADPTGSLYVGLAVSAARRLRLSGDEEGARRLAGMALAAGASGRDAETAAAIADGRALPRSDAGPVPVAVVLPLGGSPAFQIFSRELREGIEAALVAWGLDGEIDLVVMDDGGDVPTAANLVRAAEATGAVAVVGLLDDASLSEAARMRSSVPLISPTAYELPASSGPTLSLSAFDPGAAEALASWAAESGILEVAVIHASGGASADEARLFAERFQASGGTVVGSFAYRTGATFWEDEILGAVELAPDALVLAIPPEDVPGVASQVTFFGVDTLGVRLLGTGGWTDPRVLEMVEARHTDGVVVATPVRPDSASEGFVRFREAYERRFQRGLVDGAVQALGYDAASLVFQGIYAGAGRSEEVSAALARVTELSGATGRLSVVDGELRREHHVVCLEGGLQKPILPGQLPTQEYRPYQPDPETGAVPEGPGRPAGFACPLPLDSLLPGDTLLQADTLVPADTFTLRPNY